MNAKASARNKTGMGPDETIAMHSDTSSNMQKRYNCNLCSPPRSYSALRTYQLHLERHAGDTCMKFTCHTCDARFRWNYELKKHLADSKHQNQYECDVCGAKFTYRNELSKHKGELGHKKDNKLTCDICKAQLSNKRNLRYIVYSLIFTIYGIQYTVLVYICV